jgi:hypothetical protein
MVGVAPLGGGWLDPLYWAKLRAHAPPSALEHEGLKKDHLEPAGGDQARSRSPLSGSGDGRPAPG